MGRIQCSAAASMLQNDLNTPEALLLLHRAAETMLANHDINTGAEILRLARILGLRIEG